MARTRSSSRRDPGVVLRRRRGASRRSSQAVGRLGALGKRRRRPRTTGRKSNPWPVKQPIRTCRHNPRGLVPDSRRARWPGMEDRPIFMRRVHRFDQIVGGEPSRGRERRQGGASVRSAGRIGSRAVEAVAVLRCAEIPSGTGRAQRAPDFLRARSARQRSRAQRATEIPRAARARSARRQPGRTPSAHQVGPDPEPSPPQPPAGAGSAACSPAHRSPITVSVSRMK